MGTPDLAATVLEHVLEWEGGDVVAVYSQPDRPAGRGMSLKAPPVKVLAEKHGIPVLQPLNFKNAEDVAVLENFRPDYLLVAAYGLILPQRVLDIPAKYPLNVHTSLLPKYRGAAPIQRAVMNGDTETGTTIMVMAAGMDTGPIVLQETTPIGPNQTAGELHDVLAVCGGKLLVTALEGLERGNVTPTPQRNENATYAAKLAKSDGALDFARPLAAIHAQARGVTPWPGAFATLEREGEEPLPVAIISGTPLTDKAIIGNLPDADRLSPGDVFPKLVHNALAVQAVDGVYLVTALKPAGKKALDAAAFMNGYIKGRGQARFTPPA